MRVLILAYDFPPLVRVGGQRPYSWYRYLREFGVEPVVVTRQWHNRYGDDRDYVAPSASDHVVVERSEHGTILRTPYRPNLSHRLLLEHGPARYRLLRKAITAWYEMAQYFLVVGPKKGLYLAARGHLRHEPVDAIVATGEPFVLFAYASRLSAEFGVPWLADFRDPWSQDRGNVGRRLSPSLVAGLEVRCTRSASALTTVSESFRDLIGSRHAGRPIHVVPNGFDPEAVGAAADVAQSHLRLTLALAGRLNAWDPLDSFLATCERVLRQSGREIALRFIGVNDRPAIESALASRCPLLARHASFTGKLAHEQAVVELARANVLLLFNYYATVGTKIYDYLALRRRVLLCYSADPGALRLKDRHYNLQDFPTRDGRPMERLLQETSAGIVVRDESCLEQVLLDLLEEFGRNGMISCRSADIERFSRRPQAGRLAAILEELKAP